MKSISYFVSKRVLFLFCMLLYVCDCVMHLSPLALMSCGCLCVLYMCVCFVWSSVHVSDPSLHASCATTARTPSILQRRILSRHPSYPLPALPSPPCRGQKRGPRSTCPSPVPWFPRGTGLWLWWAWRELSSRGTEAVYLDSPAAP